MEDLWAKDSFSKTEHKDPSVQWPSGLCIDRSPVQYINPRLSEPRQPGRRDLPTDFTVADTVNIETCYKFHNFAYCLLTPNYQTHGGDGVISSLALLITTLFPYGCFFFQGINMPLPLCSPAIPEPLTIFGALILKPGGEGTVQTSETGTQSDFLWDEMGNQAPVKLLLVTDDCFFWGLTIKHKYLVVWGLCKLLNDVTAGWARRSDSKTS